MAIFYYKNLNTDKYNLYTTDINKKRMKYRIHIRSFIFISLSLCLISLLCISLLNVHEENIIPSIKYIEILSRNLSEFEFENENENNNNKERNNTMNHLDETNESSKNSKNNNQVTLQNKLYNDMSKKLTKKELFDILNSLDECPPKEDLINIWYHALRLGNGFGNIIRALKVSKEEALENDCCFACCYPTSNVEDTSIWTETHFAFYRTVAKEIIKYSNKYFILINGDHTLEDIIDFINSFLEHFKTLKKDLYKKHKKELLRTNYKFHY